jgi:hypothetical protein
MNNFTTDTASDSPGAPMVALVWLAVMQLAFWFVDFVCSL